MKTHFDIEQFIAAGAFTNELDYERAMVADRKLRLLAKDNEHFKTLRSRLRSLIKDYESKEWSDANTITTRKLNESDRAEKIAEKERVFIEKRKAVIKRSLKQRNLTQQNLALLLGHTSKTHMSELINGIKPFTHKDLVTISLLFDIDINKLVPVFLSNKDSARIKIVLKQLDNPKMKKVELALV